MLNHEGGEVWKWFQELKSIKPHLDSSIYSSPL